MIEFGGIPIFACEAVPEDYYVTENTSALDRDTLARRAAASRS